MKRYIPRICRLATLLVAFTLAAQSLFAAEITATLDPQDLSVGESAELTVSMNAPTSTAPSVPMVDGLDIEPVGQSTQIQMINGATTAQSTHTYLVTPQRAGTFTIPSVQLGGAKSNPLTLRVTADSGATPQSQRRAQSSAPRPSLAPPALSSTPSAVTAPRNAKFGFLQLSLPKQQFYVGELVPVEVHAYVPNGVQASVTGLPVLSSEAFTLNQLDQKPARSEQVVDGRGYTVLTWHSAITAVKAGDYSLSAQMPVTVVVTERSRSNASSSLFDEFFNDPFLSRGREKEVTLQSEPDALKVLPLPTAGRPTGFSGAVGKFEVHATAQPTKIAVGDPITLTMTVTGSGNFDRISSEVLASANDWKTYKPKSNFEPADSAGFQGTKTFEQIVMPNESGLKQIPPVSFSFFNPETQQYVSAATEPIPLEVSGTPVTSATPATPPVATSASPRQPAAEDLVPNKMDAGRPVRSLRPVFLSQWYAPAQIVPVLALIALLLFLRRRNRLATDPQFARTAAAERAIRAQLDAMDRAMRKHEPLTFFSSARSALQQRLAERWNVKPESITLAEVSSKLNGNAQGVRAVFEMADRIRFSPEPLDETDFRRWKKQVIEELKRLKEHA